MERYAQERLEQIQDREANRTLFARKKKEEHLQRDGDRWREYHAMKDGFELQSAQSRAMVKELQYKINEEYKKELAKLEEKKKEDEAKLEEMWYEVRKMEADHEQQLMKRRREIEQDRAEDVEEEKKIQTKFDVARDAERRETDLLVQMQQKFHGLDDEHVKATALLEDYKERTAQREQLKDREKAEMAKVEKDTMAYLYGDPSATRVDRNTLDKERRKQAEEMRNRIAEMRMEKEEYLDDILLNQSQTLKKIRDKSKHAEKMAAITAERAIVRKKGGTTFLPAVLASPTVAANQLPKPDVSGTPWTEEQLRDEFNKYDVDGGGWLSTHELRVACRETSERFGIPHSEADFERLLYGSGLQAVGARKKVKLDFDDFCLVMLKAAQV